MVETGGHGLLTFRRQDLIVVSPGVPLDTPELAQVKSFGLPVIGELELAARFLKGKILAVTGSNGKTTTTTLLGEILAAAGLPTLVGGNIGVPVVALIDSSTDESWSVLEVSSFQLETTEQFHPSIAVILNITPDHLDRHGSFENYCAAKERIFAQQTAEDCLGAERRQCALRSRRRALGRQGLSGSPSSIRSSREPGWRLARWSIAPTKGAATEKVMPLERHSAQRRAQRRECAGRGGCRAPGRRSGRSHSPRRRELPGRRASPGISSPPATASSSTTTPRPPTWTPPPRPSPPSVAAFISSSAARTRALDYTVLADLLRERVSAVYTIGAAAAKIESHLRGVVSIHSCETLDKAVAAAAAAARPGEVVLLAPACSSFDQFENYEQRGPRLQATGQRIEGLG